MHSNIKINIIIHIYIFQLTCTHNVVIKDIGFIYYDIDSRRRSPMTRAFTKQLLEETEIASELPKWYILGDLVTEDPFLLYMAIYFQNDEILHLFFQYLDEVCYTRAFTKQLLEETKIAPELPKWYILKDLMTEDPILFYMAMCF